jgi:hypothetical protein
MTERTSYEPPRVWEWKPGEGTGAVAFNRPIAAATHDNDLPIGQHPLQLYSLATPKIPPRVPPPMIGCFWTLLAVSGGG